MTEESRLLDLAQRYAVARDTFAVAKRDLQECVVVEHRRGKSESQIAREAGVDRMTIRKWLGK